MPKVPERKPTEWELKQKPKSKTIICKTNKPYNSWGTPKDKQGMFAKKLDNNNYTRYNR